MSDRPGQGRPTLAAMAALGFVGVIAYLPALATGFTADDFFILARVKQFDGLANPVAYFQTGFFDYYRPVALLSHALDWHVWGTDPFGFHLRNVLLHAASTILVFLIGRRLLDFPAAVLSGLLFALHPASHEAVYWVAARFDLLATFFALAAIWCLSDDRPVWRGVGLAAFALGLLSKESAISVLLVAPAWDVFVSKREWRSVVRRLVPLIAVVVAYAIVRSLGADLEATGGSRRLPKLIMTAAALAVIVFAAWRRDHGRQRSTTHAPASAIVIWSTAAAIVVVTAGLLSWPVTSAEAAEKLGFVAYAAFYLVSPVVFPSPSPDWFVPIDARGALPGLLIGAVAIAVAASMGRGFARHPEAVFLCVFGAAALLPVTSMTGGLRYLYLATAGVSLFAGWLLQQVPRAGRIAAAAIVTGVLVLSLTQVLQAGRAWRAASEMTRNGIGLMAQSLTPCGTRDVALLTAPVGIGGVYANFYYEAFDVLAGCSPRSLSTLLRVMNTNAHVEVIRADRGTIDVRVPDYRGNIVASADLRNFDVPVPPGLVQSIETPMGRLEIFAEGTTQIFRVTPANALVQAEQFYYSDGAIRKLRD